MDSGKKIVSFGEIMLRLTPPARRRFSQSALFEAGFGGSEANVAVSLANYGLHSELVTCLPPNRIADACIDDLRSYGVDTRHIVRAGRRIGLYYMEEAAAMRASQVVYDRAGSSFDGLRPGQIDWSEVFRDAGWFHWSGISAAVTAETAAVCAEAIAAARVSGLVVSCDLNYRKNLWQYGKRPDEVLPPLMEQCDVLFGTDDEYEKVLGLELPRFAACDAAYRPDQTGYEAAARQVAARFPGCRAVVFALRNVLSANHHLISGTLYTEGRLLTTRVYDIDCVVDCVGVGDAFVGGIVCGLAARPGDAQYALDFGAAACALKNTVPGDYNQFTAEEVAALAGGSTSGRIAR
ncbi:PfkB family carbohydrate kinase [Alistipes sp.]|uniref:PfkB family carbohydrate kinase n=1 Tax=Alistipes sp. TaxID=1872444 RepID=UPI003AF01701